MIAEIREVIDYIQDLLDNKTSSEEAWDASYDLPRFIHERADAILAYDERVMKLLDDEVTEVCAALDYEDDGDDIISENTFRKKLSEALKKLKMLNRPQQ